MRPFSIVLGTCLLAALFGGCCSEELRRLDRSRAEPIVARMVFRHEPGLSNPDDYKDIAAGNIIAFTAEESSSDGSVMLGAATWGYTHVAIVFPFERDTVRVLTADSERGVIIDTVEGCTGGREYYVYAFPADSLNLNRLRHFALRAAFLGRLDYDWSSAFLGLNSNLTPNRPDEVAGEYTCATAVAAALHYSGLSLDRACGTCQFVGPADIIFSRARRNLNFDPAAVSE